jgi:hypothetical protein
MKKIFIATILLSMTSATWAQQTDAIVSPMPPIKTTHEGPRMDRVLKPTQIDSERRKMLWKDKTVDQDGYLRVKSTLPYLELPTAFLKHPKFARVSMTGKSVTSPGDVEVIGKLDEDQHRVSWAFSQGNTSMIFTVWNYKAAGATYSVPEEFLNQTVGGRPAVLSLSYAENTTKALWKLTWWNDGVMYELYASDTLDRGGAPRNKAQNIVHLADLALKNVGK